MTESTDERTSVFVEAFLNAFLSANQDSERPYELDRSRIDDYRARLDEMFDPEVEIDLSALGGGLAPGFRAKYHGVDGAWSFWRAWLDSWDDYRFAVEDLQIRGDHAIWEVDVAAKGVETGIEVTTRMTQVLTLRDGRMVRFGMYTGRQDGLDAIGETDGA